MVVDFNYNYKCLNQVDQSQVEIIKCIGFPTIFYVQYEKTFFSIWEDRLLTFVRRSFIDDLNMNPPRSSVVMLYIISSVLAYLNTYSDQQSWNKMCLDTYFYTLMFRQCCMYSVNEPLTQPSPSPPINVERGYNKSADMAYFNIEPGGGGIKTLI